MSSNDLSVGQSVAPSSIERIPADSSVKADAFTSAALQSVHTSKDLKQAELQGELVTISDEQLIKAIERAVKAMQGANTQLEFSVHDKTKRIMVKVMNSETGQVLREIPQEKTLDFVAKLWEMAGILIDERR